MYDAAYYREQAGRARRLFDRTMDEETLEALKAAAQNYDEIAEDLERGAIDIRHPELMPQMEHAPPGR